MDLNVYFFLLEIIFNLLWDIFPFKKVIVDCILLGIQHVKHFCSYVQSTIEDIRIRLYSLKDNL